MSSVNLYEKNLDLLVDLDLKKHGFVYSDCRVEVHCTYSYSYPLRPLCTLSKVQMCPWEYMSLRLGPPAGPALKIKAEK